jgi:hypothetical protein
VVWLLPDGSFEEYSAMSDEDRALAMAARDSAACGCPYCQHLKKPMRLGPCEWVAREKGRPHPGGEADWENTTLIEKEQRRDIGEAWFRIAPDDLLEVDIEFDFAARGDDDAAFLSRVVFDLLGVEGFTRGYYREKTRALSIRQVGTGRRWQGSWDDLEAEARAR